jgi:hypothetical protein
VSLLLGDQAQATRLGLAAQAYVREHYIGDIHPLRYAQLLGTLTFEDLSPGIGRRPRGGPANDPVRRGPSLVAVHGACPQVADVPRQGFLQQVGGVPPGCGAIAVEVVL